MTYTSHTPARLARTLELMEHLRQELDAQNLDTAAQFIQTASFLVVEEMETAAQTKTPRLRVV